MRDLSGQTFGSYRLEGLLGRGGMGEVYRARHLRLLNRLAAVKILPTTLATDPDFLQRFEHEANSAASLDHPAILPVWDYGEHEGQPYLAMPLVTGGSLKELLEQRGPLSPAEAERYLTPIAEALDYAHSRGILHRDVKPANILLRDDGRPQLADFGIAKAIETGQTPGLTQAGSGIGTPEYMAPEQIEGHAEKKSDLYSLGMALYQMLSGRVPYDGKTPYEIAIKQLSTPLPSIRQFRPDLSPAIEQVLYKALAKDPHLRYESGHAFAEAFHEASSRPGNDGATIVQGAPDVYQQQTTPLQVVQNTTPLPIEQLPPTPTVIDVPPPMAYTPPAQEYVPPPVMPPPLVPPPGPPPRPRSNTSWPLTIAALIVAFLIISIGSLGAYAAFFRTPTPTAVSPTEVVPVATNTIPVTAGPLVSATQTAAASANATATALAAPTFTPTIPPTATVNVAATGTTAAQQSGTATAIVSATARASAAAATANTAATAIANATATANGNVAQTATAAARPTGTPTRAPTASATAPPPTNTPAPPTLTPTRAPSAPPSAAPSSPPSAPPSAAPSTAPSTAPSAAPTATKPPTSGWGPTLPPLTGGKTYDDPQGRFSFSMPTDWSKNNAGTVDATVGPTDDSANFTVNLDRVTGNTTLDAYNQTIDRQLRQQFANYTVISLDKVMVGAQQAYRRVSRGTYLGQNLEFVLVYFINKNTAHLLTGVCAPADFDRLAPTFDGMAGSYKVGE